MATMRLQNNVPQIYLSESRDFQLLIRLLDCVQGAIKFNIDTVAQVTNTQNIDSAYLEHLKTKLGFFTDNNIANDKLRFILDAFPYIIKYKGSREGIVKAVNCYLKVMGIPTSPKIEIINTDNNGNDFIIKIGIGSSVEDTTLLEEILKYILPTGYYYEIYFYTSVSNTTSNFEMIDKCTIRNDVNIFNNSMIIGEPSNNSKIDDRLRNSIELAYSDIPLSEKGDNVTK